MKTIRWGIIGCGDVTEVKSGPGFQKAENSSLVAVMRRNGALAEDYAKRHNVPKWYDDADKLINDPDVDAVYIATPPAYHKEYTLRTAKAGKPVYVEKPMAMNYMECREMVECCRIEKVPLFTAYYRRGLERFNKVRELVNAGAIGSVRFVTITQYQKPLKEETEGVKLPWRVVPEISGGGKFLDVASHTLDIMDYILGPVKEVCGMASNQAGLYKAEDIVTASFMFSSGVQGAGTWCFSSFSNFEMNEIVGSLGKLAFSTFGSEPVLLTTNEGTTEFPLQNPVHIQQPLIQSIVNELNGSGRCPSTGESGVRTSWVMDEVLKGYRGFANNTIFT